MSNVLLKLDQQQSVLTGTAGHSRAYTPYGVPNTVTGPGLGFCGQHRDPLTGCYGLGNGHRYYSPTLMRFVSADNLSPFVQGGINTYAYCGGEPVNRHDPSGAYWLGVVLRAVGVFSSGATLFGATVRTMKNVVGRRSAGLSNPPGSQRGGTETFSTTSSTTASHQDLPQLSRVSNQQFAMTGIFGLAGQIAAAARGVSPTLQTLTDVFALGNSITNLSGGSIGNFAAAREVSGYLRGSPHEIIPVAWETILDLTMVDEMLSTVGRGFQGAARRIRSTRPAPHGVHV